MPYYYYPMDTSYLTLVLPAVLLALVAQIMVKSAFRKYSQVGTSRGQTGARVAETILRDNGLFKIRVERVQGSLSDHYDPKAQVIRLSGDVFDGSSVAAVSVAAHEAGHAIQYGVGYAPIRIRQAVIPVSRFGSFLAMPLVLIGLVLSSLRFLVYVGLLFFAAAVVFQLVTLPVEFNASRRALRTLEGRHILDEEELPGAKRMLTAAALTYVAALMVSIMQFLRLLLLVSGGRGRRR